MKPKYIETPEKMWELFEEYRTSTKNNPILVQDFVGKDGNEVHRERERPLTMEGFKNFCRRKVGCVEQYFTNQDELYTEYIGLCRAIREEIRQDQIEGGMASIYNPSITQRLNGLTEKTDVTTGGERIGKIEIEIIRGEDKGDSSI